MSQGSTAHWDYSAATKRTTKTLHLSAKGWQWTWYCTWHRQTVSDVGDSSSDIRNTGTELNSQLLSDAASRTAASSRAGLHTGWGLCPSPTLQDSQTEAELILLRHSPADSDGTGTPLTVPLAHPRRENLICSGILINPYRVYKSR